VCHKKYIPGFPACNSLPAKLLGNLKRKSGATPIPLPPLSERTNLPNAGKFCRSQNYSNTEVNLCILADKIIDGFITETNSGIKSRIFVILRPDKPF